MEDNTLNKLLQKIADEEKFTQPDIKMKEISTGGANFTSNLRLITINDKKSKHRGTLKLFAKIAAVNENFRGSIEDFPAYIVERIAYTELFPAYKQLEEKHGLSAEYKLLMPKYYGADLTRLQETLVLEDLGSKGYQLYSRFKSVEWPYASAALTELAKFHALSFAFQHENPAEFNNLSKTFRHLEYPESAEIDASSKKLTELAITNVHEKNKQKLQKFFDTFGVNMAVISKISRPLKYMVLVHGDFRPSNMMYRRIENGAIEVIPVDYQTIQPGCPAADLVYFIISGTDGPFRAQYYQPLLDYYYSQLRAALDRLGLDVKTIYPRDEFESEVKQKLPYGLAWLIMLLPLLTAEEDKAPKVEDFDLNAGFNLPTGDLYRTRLNEIVEDCVTWGVLTD